VPDAAEADLYKRRRIPPGGLEPRGLCLAVQAPCNSDHNQLAGISKLNPQRHDGSVRFLQIVGTARVFPVSRKPLFYFWLQPGVGVADVEDKRLAICVADLAPDRLAPSHPCAREQLREAGPDLGLGSRSNSPENGTPSGGGGSHYGILFPLISRAHARARQPASVQPHCVPTGDISIE